MAAKLLPGNKYFQTMRVGAKRFQKCLVSSKLEKAGGPSISNAVFVQKIMHLTEKMIPSK